MLEELYNELKLKIGNNLVLQDAIPLSGGDINTVYKLITSEGIFCVKLNDAKRYPMMFEKEKNGLETLKKYSRFAVPEVIDVGNTRKQSFLLLSFIDSSNRNENYWNNFGCYLAEMHKNTQPQFGLNEDNYIGSLVQQNDVQSNWVNFFHVNRLQKQLTLGVKNGLFDKTDEENAHKLCKLLHSILPTEPPSLLHGDLWSGNIMTDKNGDPAIIDPAIYFGHREMDLAMTQLFGGFDRSMYEAYHSTYPLEKNWEERIEIHNLYPLLVHANLFGGAYVRQVKTTLKKFK